MNKNNPFDLPEEISDAIDEVIDCAFDLGYWQHKLDIAIDKRNVKEEIKAYKRMAQLNGKQASMNLMKIIKDNLKTSRSVIK